MNIFFLGYMASGKSTIGSALAEKMNFQYIDLDQYIENKERMSISELFAKKGEIYFRKIETTYLTELIANQENSIISLGGGTPCYGNNLEELLNAKNTITIYLKASLNELVKRLVKDKDKRPLIAHLKTESEVLEFIGKHLFERSYYYNQAAEIINVDDKNTDTIVEEIILNLF